MNRNVVENNWKLRWHDAIIDAVEVMDWDIVEGDWNQTKSKVKERWSKLTNDQLDMLSGRRDELVDKIQECYGVAKYEAKLQVKDWEARNDEWFEKAARRIHIQNHPRGGEAHQKPARERRVGLAYRITGERRRTRQRNRNTGERRRAGQRNRNG